MERVMQDTLSLRPRMFWWVAILIVLVGFGLRVWQLGEASLWDDEAMTKLRAEAPLDQFLRRVQDSGNQMPLYFATLHLFPTESEFWLRLPSVLAGTAGIALLMFVTVRLYGNDCLALVAGALLALNPYHIWFSRTARPYALLFVLTLLASYFFLVLLRGERSRGNWIGFVLSSMAAYLTHYFAAALPLVQYIWLVFVLRGKRRVFWQWAAAQVIAVIPTLIWIVALLRREVVSMGIDWIKRPVPADPVFTIWNLTLDYDGTATWYAVLGLVAVFAGLLPALYYGFRKRQTDQVSFYWFWLLIAPLSLTFVLSLFAHPLFVDRYFMVLLPALLLLIASGWMQLPRRAGVLALLIVAVVGMNNVLTTLHDGKDERQAWRDAAHYVAQGYRPEDGFVISSQVALFSFLIYFDDLDVLNRTILFDLPEAGPDGAPVRGDWQTPVTRMWAVYSEADETLHNEGVLPNRDPFKNNGSQMARWLDKRRDQIIARRDFNGVTVFLVDVQNDVYNLVQFKP
jgi:uncharacterized membrane protein